MGEKINTLLHRNEADSRVYHQQPEQKRKTSRKKSEPRKGIKANIRCNGTYIIISMLHPIAAQMYTITWARCNLRHSFLLCSFQCFCFLLFAFALFSLRIVEFCAGSARKWKIKVYHIRFGTYIMQRTTHSLTGLFSSSAVSSFDFCDCINMDCFRRVAFIFSIIIIHLPTVWADFMNAFILTLSNLMANAVD